MTREEALQIIKDAYPGFMWDLAPSNPAHDSEGNELPATVVLMANRMQHGTQEVRTSFAEQYNEEAWLALAGTIVNEMNS